jgi:hypothetical protein
MAATEGVIAAIDQLIALFNGRQMDLPDDFFDRKTQFVINGAPFETLLGQSPSDPLVLMLARGPAGFRFTAKGLQHAMPDARVDRPSTPTIQLVEPASPGTAAGSVISLGLRLSGTLRDSGQAVDTTVGVTLRMTPAGRVEIAEATMDPATLERIRQARRS